MTSSSTSTTTLSSEQPSLTYLRPEVAELKCRLELFIEDEVLPAEKEFMQHLQQQKEDRFSTQALPPSLEKLQQRARQLQLWNLFLPPRLLSHYQTAIRNYNNTRPNTSCGLPESSPVPFVGGGDGCLTYREYGILAEVMGRSGILGSMACNCSAPDTGNMEVLLEFGTPQQQSQYLIPLLQGKIRSTFLMTEPNVASSDPTNLETCLVKHHDGSYTLSGRKWWSTGAMDPRCRIAIVVAKLQQVEGTQQGDDDNDNDHNNNNKHGRHTICMVPLPHPNVQMVRPLTVFGHDDAPFGHAEVLLKDVALGKEHLIGGEGMGFQVSQARLGPGRIHHCMRAVGMAQRCFELMLQRVTERKTFGKYLWQHGSVQRDIADAFGDLHAARLMTLNCAHEMDRVGPKACRQYISSIKVAVPQLCFNVIDKALQVHGGAGVSDDYILAQAWTNIRALRLADGPDEVHRRSVALLELKRYHHGLVAPSSTAVPTIQKSKL